MVADQALSEELGANMVHIADEGCTNENGKSLEDKGLTIKLEDWRRGESKPHPTKTEPLQFHYNFITKAAQ